MKRTTLDAVWADWTPIYREGAGTGRLPFYRDWSRPVTEARRGDVLGGLAALFLPEPWTDRYALNGGGEVTARAPVAHRFVWRDASKVEAVAGYPTRQRKPVTEPAPEPLALARGLGYSFKIGEQLQEQNRVITLARAMDVVDLLGESIRLIVHREWSRRGQAGYLGAELLFGMIAAELRLDAGNLHVQPGLREELRVLNAEVAINATFFAAALAATLLGEGLGGEQAERFRLRMTEPGGTADLGGGVLTPDNLGYFLDEVT